MANDFSSESSWVAVYKFESGALLDDYTDNANDLTNVNSVTENTTDYDEGSCSADFESAYGSRLTRLDADLSANFPGKSGTDVAVSVRFRFESFPSDDIQMVLVNKGIESSAWSWKLQIYNSLGTYYLQFCLGYNSGGSEEVIDLCSASFSTAVWYYLGFSYDDSTQTYYYTLYARGTPDTQLSEGSGSTANQMSVDNGRFSIGCRYANSTSGARYWDGEMDEVAISNSPKTKTDFDAIRTGTYGAGGSTLSPNIINYYKQRRAS